MTEERQCRREYWKDRERESDRETSVSQGILGKNCVLSRKRDYGRMGKNASGLGNLTEIAYSEEGENICRRGILRIMFVCSVS